MQPDLFGERTWLAPAYVVPHDIAVNTLRKTWEKLAAAAAWPWDPDMKAARMGRSVPKLLAVLPSDEAEAWRARLDAEAARLTRPPDHAPACPLNLIVLPLPA